MRTYHVMHTQIERKCLLCIKPVELYYGLPDPEASGQIVPVGTILYIAEAHPHTWMESLDAVRFYGDVLDSVGRMFYMKAKYGTRKKFKQHFLVL